MAFARVLAKVIGVMAGLSAGAMQAWCASARAKARITAEAGVGGGASSGGTPGIGVDLSDGQADGQCAGSDLDDHAAFGELDRDLDIALGEATPLRVVPELLMLLADSTRSSSAHDDAMVRQLAAEFGVLIVRYGTVRQVIEAVAIGRRRMLHVAQDKAQAWQQVMAVSASMIEPALRRNHALLAHLTGWVNRQPGDLEHRLDRCRGWLDEEDPAFAARVEACKGCLDLLHAQDDDGGDQSGRAFSDRGSISAIGLHDTPTPDGQPVGTVIGEPGILLLPPPLMAAPNERIEAVLGFVVDAKHPAEQLAARTIDLHHRQMAEWLRRSEDPVERLVGAIALCDFDFADAALTAQSDRLGPVNGSRLRGDRLYWEGRFGEAVPHYRAHLEAHDDLIARCNLACALIRSERGSREENGEEALSLLRQTLRLLPRGTPEHARVMLLLGAAKELVPIGNPIERRREALRCYEEALHALERERDGIWWAGAHLHAGLALLAAGESPRGEHNRHAMDHFVKALEHWTRDSDPAHWSTVQNNLGRALERLPFGDRRRNLENAKACYEAALEVRTRDEHPTAWARLQNNLGNLHLHLPDPDGISHINRAIEHHTEAARVWSTLGKRQEWASSQTSLGNAYAMLPHHESDGGDRDRNLHRAISCYRSALEVRTKSTAPGEWATIMNNLGSVLVGIPDRPGRSEHIDDAIRCFQHALEIRDRDTSPLDWARTTANLANALSRRSTGDRQHQLSEALALINEAIEVAAEYKHPELHRHLMQRREQIQHERSRAAHAEPH